MNPRSALIAPLAFLPLLGVASALPAQLVRGRVLEAGSEAPVRTAVVSLLRADSVPTGRQTLTDGSGAFAIAAPVAGAYLIDVRAIGYRRTRHAVELTAGATEALTISLVRNNVSLASVRIEGRRSCQAPERLASATSEMWDDVWAALTATTLAQTGLTSRWPVFRYQRELDAFSGRVKSETRTRLAAAAQALFAAASPNDLAKGGFLQQDDAGNLEIFAPDATTFLSPEFIARHCFAVTRGPSGATPRLGIAFWPQRSWATRGIEGVFWLDAQTRELRTIDFTYPGLAQLASPAVTLGGEVRFGRDLQGSWFVARWNIRAPVIQRTRRSTRSFSRQLEQEQHDSVASISEEGGVVLTDSTVLARIEGTVVAGASREPVGGSLLEILGTGFRATADSAGRFVIDSLLPGTYRIRATRSGSGSPVGMWYEQAIAVMEGERAAHDLLVQDQRSLARGLCPRMNARTLSTTAVYGVVREERTGAPMAGRSVDMRWLRYVIEGASQAITVRTEIQSLTTDSAGVLHSCSAPPRADVGFRATTARSDAWSTPQRLGAELTVLDLRIDASGRISRVEGGIPIPGASADLADERRILQTLRGSVVADDAAATPVAGAEVRIVGLPRAVRSDADGRFSVDSIAEGVYVVSIRRLGFAPATELVAIGDQEPAERAFRLSPVATIVEGVIVTANADVPSIGLREFQERRTLGLGKFIGPDDFERAGGAPLGSLLMARIQGFDFVPLYRGSLSAGLGVAARRFSNIRQGAAAGPPKPCFAQVIVDGVRVSGMQGEPWDVTQLNTSDIAAMEFYRGAAETPTQFSGPSAACGTVVIWMRSN